MKSRKTKREKTKKPRVRGKKSLRRECDRLVGAACRAVGKCEFCGMQRTLQWCHYISRAVIKLRYNRNNNACLCYGCHVKGHQHPGWFTEQWDKLKGWGTTLYLEQESNRLEPITVDFYLNILTNFKNEVYNEGKSRSSGEQEG
jgi:hypothetical protein